MNPQRIHELLEEAAKMTDHDEPYVGDTRLTGIQRRHRARRRRQAAAAVAVSGLAVAAAVGGSVPRPFAESQTPVAEPAGTGQSDATASPFLTKVQVVNTDHYTRLRVVMDGASSNWVLDRLGAEPSPGSLGTTELRIGDEVAFGVEGGRWVCRPTTTRQKVERLLIDEHLPEQATPGEPWTFTTRYCTLEGQVVAVSVSGTVEDR